MLLLLGREREDAKATTTTAKKKKKEKIKTKKKGRESVQRRMTITLLEAHKQYLCSYPHTRERSRPIRIVDLISGRVQTRNE